MENSIPSDIILRLNEEAEDKRKKYPEAKIINATIGMFFDDRRNLAFNKTLADMIKLHNKEEDLVYPPISGTQNYKKAIEKWFIDSYYDIDKNIIRFNATPGGTGALHLAINKAMKNDDSLLLIPKISWPNYVSIAKSNNLNYRLYDNYDSNNRFNLKGIEDIISDSNCSSFVLLLNDPCQNPTGYSLSEKDYQDLITLIKNKKDKKITIIFDLAYFDYADDEIKVNLYKNIDILKDHSDIFICYSFSKSFSVYGLRVGGLAIISKNPYLNDLAKEVSILARSSWSTVNHLGMNVVSDLVLNQESYLKMKESIHINKELLKKRSKIFLNEASDVNLKIYNYSAGFFITVPVEDSLKVIDELKKKNIYLAPISFNEIRIALSCLATDEVYNLAKEIKGVISYEK